MGDCAWRFLGFCIWSGETQEGGSRGGGDLHLLALLTLRQQHGSSEKSAPAHLSVDHRQRLREALLVRLRHFAPVRAVWRWDLPARLAASPDFE